LIDEFAIFVMPVMLGSGIRLFENNNKPLDLKLTNSKVNGSGGM
jgi:dihydrofolate reductase